MALDVSAAAGEDRKAVRARCFLEPVRHVTSLARVNGEPAQHVTIFGEGQASQFIDMLP